MLEIQILAWDKHKKCGGVKLVNGITTITNHCMVLYVNKLEEVRLLTPKHLIHTSWKQFQGADSCLKHVGSEC